MAPLPSGLDRFNHLVVLMLEYRSFDSSHYSIIMRCFPPEAVPVLSALARQFVRRSDGQSQRV